MRAENGGNGEQNMRAGADGDDRIIRVPVGTVARDMERGKEYDIVFPGQKVLVARGGNSGWQFSLPLESEYDARPGESRAPWRIGDAPIGAQNDRRYRTYRVSECREIESAQCAHRRVEQSRELPLHDARAEPWRIFRHDHRRYSRAYRGRVGREGLGA